MSCYISKQIRQYSSYIYHIFEDSSYDNIANGIIWNLKFAIPLLIIALLLWSKVGKVCGNLLSGLQRGEDVYKIGQRIQTNEHGEGLKGKLKQDWKDFRKGFLKWFVLDKDYLIGSCSESAYLYLCFQRGALAFQFVLLILVLSILLPINLSLGSNFKSNSFAGTTMSNIDAKANYNAFWAHVLISVAILPATLFSMKLFLNRIHNNEASHLKVKRTLYLSGLPTSYRTTAAIMAYFRSNYPGSGIVRVRVNTRVGSVEDIEDKYDLLSDILEECQHNPEERIFTLRCCPCCWDSPSVPTLAIDYYTQKKAEVEVELRQRVHMIVEQEAPIDAAFLQIETLEKARQIVFLHKNRIGKRKFKIDFAPDDILWSSMTHKSFQKLKAFLVDIFFLCAIILIVNADTIVTVVDTMLYARFGENEFSDLLNKYPVLKNAWTLLMAELWTLIITIVWGQAYWTETFRNCGFVVRTFFAFFVVLYLVPIFNIKSILHAIVESAQSRTTHFQWNCIFLADNGAYFIGNMVIMGMFWLSFSLTRWKIVFCQLYSIVVSKSWSEIRARCKHDAYEDFAYDTNMAEFLLNYTICICLAPASPLIAIFGVLYSILKHCADSYFLLSGVQKATEIDPKPFFLTLTNIVTFAAILSQINTIFCIFVCSGSPEEKFTYVVAKVAPIIILVSIVVFIHQIQTNQRWPIRVKPKEPVLPQINEVGSDPEPNYEPPVYKWI